MPALLLENFQLIKNRYRIIRLVSRGGEGYLYLAQDALNNNRICVMKQMYHSQEELMGIENDYQTFSGLYHQNIVQVLDFFWDLDTFYVVMNFIAGETLKENIKRSGPVQEIKVLNWSLKIAHVLRFLHNQKPNPIFHADIAPENIMITPSGDLVLIDFGIARAGYEAVGLRENYSAPEQMQGILDSSSDVYSLGATMYRCLTGQDQMAPEADPREIVKNISPKTAELVKKSTAKDKTAFFGFVKKRHANIDEFIDDLKECLTGSSSR